MGSQSGRGSWAIRVVEVVEVVWLVCMVRLVRLVRVDRVVRMDWAVRLVRVFLGCKAGSAG